MLNEMPVSIGAQWLRLLAAIRCLKQVLENQSPRSWRNALSTLTNYRPRLTERARDVLAKSHVLAASHHDAGVSAGHVMLAMLDGGQNVASYVLRQRGIEDETLSQALRAALTDAAVGPPNAANTGVGTAADEAFTERAQREADALDSLYIGVEHLLLALLRDASDPFTRVLYAFGVEYADARDGVRAVNSPVHGN